MNESVRKTLERLNKTNQGNRKPAGSIQKTPYYKMKEGKNNLMIVVPSFTEDPFMPWASHKGLLDQDWMEVACDHHNLNNECIVCDVISDLKAQDWKGNMPLWKPIEQKIRNYSWVIDLDDVDGGLKLWGYGKSVSSQFETWLQNLEEDETPFYEATSPEKIVVNFDKNATAIEMYKLDKKILKPFPKDQYQAWQEQTKPLAETFTFTRTQEEVSKLVAEYMERMKEELLNAEAHGDSTPLAQNKAKLSKLKD